MAHRLRYAMVEDGLKLTGVVGMDEAYIGAKRVRGTKRGRPGIDSDKVPVVALVERGGKVRAFPVDRVTGDTLKKALYENTTKRVTLVTDELRACESIKHPDHQTVNHSCGEYVRADVHTNTVEGFFSLLKRGIVGSFHHVSKGHLHRYTTEFEFRYNRRHATDGERAADIARGAEGKRLTYRQPSGTRAA